MTIHPMPIMFAMLCVPSAALWHPTRNQGLTPKMVPPGAGLEVWWKCNVAPDHEWQAPVRYVTRAKGKETVVCPCCLDKQVSVTNSLETCCPEVANQWHPTKNGDVTPADVVRELTATACLYSEFAPD